LDPVRFHSQNASSSSSNSHSDRDQGPGDFWLCGAFIESIRHQRDVVPEIPFDHCEGKRLVELVEDGLQVLDQQSRA